MELRNEVGRRVGCQLPGTLVFDYPTTAAITAYLVDRLAPTLPGTDKSGASPAAAPHGMAAAGAASGMGADSAAASTQPVLLTAVRSRLAEVPGVSSTVTQDAIQTVPADRWDADFGQVMLRFGGGGGSKTGRVPGLAGRFGGFILHWSTFDPELFAIPPTGRLRPPQQRVASVC